MTRNGEVLDREVVRRGGDQADARRDLRGERTGKGEDEEPEDEVATSTSTAEIAGARRKVSHDLRVLGASAVETFHAFSAAIIAGTISKRSPTMP